MKLISPNILQHCYPYENELCKAMQFIRYWTLRIPKYLPTFFTVITDIYNDNFYINPTHPTHLFQCITLLFLLTKHQ